MHDGFALEHRHARAERRRLPAVDAEPGGRVDETRRPAEPRGELRDPERTGERLAGERGFARAGAGAPAREVGAQAHAVGAHESEPVGAALEPPGRGGAGAEAGIDVAARAVVRIAGRAALVGVVRRRQVEAQLVGERARRDDDAHGPGGRIEPTRPVGPRPDDAPGDPLPRHGGTLRPWRT